MKKANIPPSADSCALWIWKLDRLPLLMFPFVFVSFFWMWFQMNQNSFFVNTKREKKKEKKKKEVVWCLPQLTAQQFAIADNSLSFKPGIILRLWVCLIFKVKNVIFALSKGYNLKREPHPRWLMRDSSIWCFNVDILNLYILYARPGRRGGNEATHSCGINGIAEKKGRAGYHFNRTVRVQWFFLVIFIWGFYVCASWFKGTLNHWGWGVVDYAFNQVAGLGKVAGRIARASAQSPITLWLSWKEPVLFSPACEVEINGRYTWLKEGAAFSDLGLDFQHFHVHMQFRAWTKNGIEPIALFIKSPERPDLFWRSSRSSRRMHNSLLQRSYRKQFYVRNNKAGEMERIRMLQLAIKAL